MRALTLRATGRVSVALFVAAIVLAHPAPTLRIVAAHRATFTAVAANIRSYPPMRAWQYRHDIRRLVRIKGRKAVMGAEISRPVERRIWRHRWHAAGYAVEHLDRETAQATAPEFRVLASYTRRIHAKAPGPASPPRWWVLTQTHVGGFKVVVLSLHLTNGCFPHNADRWFYPARCRAVDDEIRLVRHRVARLHRAGWSVVVGGDMNRHTRIGWAKREAVARPAGVMQLAVVPAPNVHARLFDHRVIRCRRHGGHLFTDHNVNVTAVALTR